MKHVLNFVVGTILVVTCPIWMVLYVIGMAVCLATGFGAALVEGIKEWKNDKK